MNDEFKVRDMRHKEKFYVDDYYLDTYAKLCGKNATLVYFCLCRHIDLKQKSFPAIEYMADKLDVSRDSIMRGIKSLVDFNIISKEKTRRKDAQWINNTYILLDKSVWKGSQVAQSDVDEPSRKIDLAKSQNSLSQVAQSDTKESHTKVTHNKESHIAIISESNDSQVKDINLVIEMFKVVNPSVGRLYGNTTQRASVSRLLKQHGMAALTKVISFLPKSNTTEYMPVVTTPLQLETKFGQLAAAWQKIKNKPKQVIL